MKRNLLVSKKLMAAALISAPALFMPTAHANNTLALSVGFVGTIDEPTRYGNAASLNLWLGMINDRGNKLAPYVNAAVPSHELSNREPDANRVSRINGGLTYAAAERVTLYGGLGLSYQRVQSDTLDIEAFNRSRLNVNAGLMFHINEQLGMSISFDSTPKSIGFGVVYKFN